MSVLQEQQLRQNLEEDLALGLGLSLRVHVPNNWVLVVFGNSTYSAGFG